ncbi:hypothetical protein [Microseira sp. BLCC-F43]|jgi:hypothetical protein|uniref:hypothetical protein n=1 Tax=Microseira sp. BLCC-F43 TaxID=3153602 RepID=UPI0035B72BCB
MKWMILLEGDDSHLSTLSKQLISSECNVVESDGSYYLYSSRFDSLTSHDKDLDACADEIIQHINGGGLIKIAAICQDENGQRSCKHRGKFDVKIDTSSITMEVEIRSLLSLSHIKSAVHLAKLSYEIEAADDGKRPAELFYEHRSYVTGSIITAVSYLEATINEFFVDIADGYSSIKLSPDADALMDIMWKQIEKSSILEKYQIALTLAQKNLFDKGCEPYQSASDLIEVRNALVHYKPEWVGNGDGYEKTLSEKLRRKLENRINRLNPLADAGNCAFFPHKCLGYGCAKWTVESCVKFTDEFFSRIGLPSNLDSDRSNLNLPNIP